MSKNQAKADDTFQHRQAAFNWLRTNGHAVSKSAFYGHCKEGRLQLNSNGTLNRSAVIRYAQGLDKSTVATSDFLVQKEELELRKLQLSVDKLEREARHDNDQWLYKDEAYAQMAAFFGTLIDSIEHYLLSGMNELIEEVDGNQALRERGYDVAESLIHNAINEVLEGGKINRVLTKSPA